MLPLLRKSLLICYVICCISKPIAVLAKEKKDKHPLHLSSTELNYNAKTGTVEISCRVFADDFEDLISKKYKVKSDLSAAASHATMDALIKKYMANHLQLSVNGKNLPLNYVGFENDKEAIMIYVESDQVKNITKMEVSSTVLYDLFEDQTNIFHVTVNGNRKSSKLTYPDKTLDSSVLL